MEPEYDLSQVIQLTHNKTKHIIARDRFSVTGFVLTKENGDKCIVDMSAVRWMSRDEFFTMMHPVPNANVTGAEPVCEASSREAATSTVVLEGGATGGND